jgi:hypothetical protein
MTTNPYPTEVLDNEEDDGTIVGNVEELEKTVVGRRIVSAEKREITRYPYGPSYPRKDTAFIITLDDGTEVQLFNTDDCCAFTELSDFWLDPTSVDHVITGVGTTDGYNTWHIFADFGDILKLDVDWSPGNPFYYGYGFEIDVKPVDA